MKNTILLGSLLLVSTSAMATGEIVKSCSSKTSRAEGIRSTTNITIRETADALVAQVENKKQGMALELPANVKDHSIRAGLSLEANNLKDANHGERLVLHAMLLKEELKGQASAGFDLNKVRSVRVYSTGTGNLGEIALVEGFDANQKYLGTFHIDLFLRACK